VIPAPVVVPAPVVAPAPVAAAPTPAPAPAPKPVQPFSLEGDSSFAKGSATLTPEAKKNLDSLVTKLQGVKVDKITAVGHTDNTGAAAQNDKLSKARAEAVKKYLASKGVDAKLISTDGQGSKQPIADNSTVEGKAKNRRVEIDVAGTRK
jgi:OmpA-OmpF porin, OOP family